MPSSFKDVLKNVFPGFRLKWVRDQQQIGDIHLDFGRVFSYKSLKNATNNFNTPLGRDTFRSYYKGTLEDGTVISVMLSTNQTYENDMDLFSVMKMMSRINHRNVVEFLVYCIENSHRLIVYKFAGDHALSNLLFSSERGGDFVLNWDRRASICLGIARGLEYLHQGITPLVIHRDIKPSNVLLDDNFEPKITGFEMGRPISDDDVCHSGHIAGTTSYKDPEYLLSGLLTEKVDVYSFGVLVLEVVSGRQSTWFRHESGINFLQWVWELRETGRVLEIVDPSLSEFPEEEVVRFITIGLYCVQGSSQLRPNMFEVFLMLSGGYDFSKKVLINPWYIANQNTDCEVLGSPSREEELEIEAR